MKAIDRLYQYIQFKGSNPFKFEKENGFSNGYLGTQKKRKGGLGEEVLVKILDNCLDINAAWLLTGKGEMLKNNSERNTAQQRLEEISNLKDKIIALQEELISLQKKLENKKTKNEAHSSPSVGTISRELETRK